MSTWFPTDEETGGSRGASDFDSDDRYSYYDDDSRYDDSDRYEQDSGNWNANPNESGSGKNDSSLSGLDNSTSDWGNRVQQKQNNAKNFAKKMETNASKSGGPKANESKFASAVHNAKDTERNGFDVNVQGKALQTMAAAAPGGKIIVSQAKKLGPIGTILILITALIGVFAGTQSLAPFGLVANGLDQFNNLRTSMNKRTTYFKRFSLDKSRNKPLTKKATIFNPEHFVVSKKQSKKLAKNNIYYFSEKDGYQARFLVYEDEDTGKRYAVAANDNDVQKLPNSVEVEIDGKKQTIEINTKAQIDDALRSSDNFLNAFDRGTRTVKGHIAGWFDDLSAKFHLRIGSSRNKFKGANDDADEDDIKKRAHTAEDGGTDKGLSEDIKGDEGDAKEKKPKTVCCDKDGNSYETDVPEDIGNDSGVKKKDVKNLSDAEIQTKTNSSLTMKAKQIAGAAGQGVNIACTALKVYSAINVLIAAIHVANVINYLTGFLEAIQKTQAGDAGKSELAFYMNNLSEKGNTYDSEGNVVRENTSSLQSPAWNQFFSSGSLVVQASDPLAEKFNKEYVADRSLANAGGIVAEGIGGAITALGGAAAAYTTCLYADMAVALTEAVIDVVLAFFTVGIGNFIKQIGKEIFKQVALGLVVAAITSIFFAFLPHIAKWMAMDLIENMAGEDAAYAINSGFNIYAGGQMQMSSGLPATKDTLMAHYRAQQEVIAAEAEYERSQRSPFDPTSKYTFVGSIVNSLMPIANTWSSPLITVSRAMTTVGSSISSILPTAKADGEVVFETSLNYNCPNLRQIGIVGDAYCNPYFVTDMTTMATDPGKVIDKVSTEKDKNGTNDNFIWDGADAAEAAGEPYNPEINPKGELAKWVVACAVRDSPFGTIDSNVIDAISILRTGDATLDTVVNTGVSAIPIIGDIAQITQDAKEVANTGWATGEKCISEDFKYYSRYSEDQRMLESMGLIEKSSVAKLLDDYYEMNPIDNSTEGIIARYSGLRKNEVEETIAFVEYQSWLADYDPSESGPKVFDKKDDTYQYESNEIIAKEDVIVNRYIVYDDLRTKVKVA